MPSEENKDKLLPPIPPPPMIPPPSIPPQPNPIILLGQAISNLSQRASQLEIDVAKANANFEVMSNRLDLLKSTIELLEKQVDFNEKTRE